MTQLTTLFLQSNQLTGTLPPEWKSFSQLQFFQLQGNNFTGTIPNAWRNMTNLVFTYFNNNQLSGEIPNFLLNTPSMQDLRLSNNKFIGAPLALPFAAPSLQILMLQSNNFTGTITSTFGNKAPQLVTALIQDNEFTGSLPASLIKMKQLSSFIAHRNNFQGQIPEGLGNASNLTNLALAGNRLDGPIPTSLGNSKSLEILILRANKLSGTIPSYGFASNPHLRVLDLAQNNFDGILPPFPADHNIEKIQLSSNSLTGTTSKELLQLRNLSRLEIDRNFFSCELPKLKEYNRTLSCRDNPTNWTDGTDACTSYAANSYCGKYGNSIGTNGLTANQACCTCGGGNRTLSSYKGLPSIKFPTDHAASAAAIYSMSMLVGNTFGCPIDDTLIERDLWGAVYECGWEGITGIGGKITSPAGMTLVSLTMVTVVLILRCCVPAAAAAAPLSDETTDDKTPRSTVNNESTDLFSYISSTLKVSCALGIGAAALTLPAFLTAHSPIQCQYALTHTGAYKDNGFPSFLVEIAALLFALILIGWVVAQNIRQMKIKMEKTKALKETTDVNIGDVYFVLSGDLENKSSNAISVAHPNGSTMSIDAAPVHQKVHQGDVRLPFEPAAVMWENATHHANESRHLLSDEEGDHHHVVISSSGLRKACREASWEGFIKLIVCVIGCLIFGLVPNVLYVLVESGVITLSGNTKSIATLFIVGMKQIANLVVAPAAASFGANAMRPSSKFMHARVRTVLKVWLTFFNTLGWPMFSVIALSPICFRDLLVPPDAVEFTYSYGRCAITGDPSDNAGGFKFCREAETNSKQAQVSQPFQWNTQCPSTILQIYGPIYILLFAYGIIASAVSLFLTSGSFKRVVAWNEARKERKAAAAAAAANNKNEHEDKQQGTKKKYCCCTKKEEKKKKKKKKKKKPLPPTLGVIDYYSGSALNVAVIASFGFFYPSVAILGVIHMALNAHATRMKVNDMLACQKGPKRADLLRIEGASGLPASAVVAIVGINAGLFFFVFGPFGMITTPSIQMAAYVAPALALFGVVFSKFLAHQWQLRAAHQLEKLTPALNIPLMDRMSEGMSSMRSSLNLDGGETKGATDVARNDGDDEAGSTSIRDMLERYAESFDEWSKMQEEELEEEEEEEEEPTRERYSIMHSSDVENSGNIDDDEMSRHDTVISSESFSLDDDVDRDASAGEK
jgi:hypothetical protein